MRLALSIPPESAERILLGGSPDSAALAARHGWQFCYAGHFNGDEANLEESVRTYRDATGRAPLLALYAVAAPTQDEADELVGPLRIFRLQLATGQCVNLATAEAASEFARQTGVSDFRIDERHPHVIKGTADAVRQHLDALSERFGIEEFVIDSPLQTYPERLRSVELLGATISTTSSTIAQLDA